MQIPRLSFGKLVPISSSLMTLLLAMNMHALASHFKDDGADATEPTIMPQAQAAERPAAGTGSDDPQPSGQDSPTQAGGREAIKSTNDAQGWMSLLTSDENGTAVNAVSPSAQAKKASASEGGCQPGVPCARTASAATGPDGDVDPKVGKAEADLVRDILARRSGIDSEQKTLDDQRHVLNAANAALDQRMRDLDASMAQLAQKQAAQREIMLAETDRLVRIYEDMPAKEAAAVFNIMDIHVLVSLANTMSPRKVSAIMGYMTPERVNLVSQFLAGVRSFHTTHASDDGKAEQAADIGASPWWSRNPPTQRLAEQGPLKPSRQ
ncbi:hypothetical protein JUN65_06315 [Gluconacetobacter azotocaptans]|uniref:MotE family protein n=1 Tax=Gluconacetobacter azotocaptans TaxID=142834 RepID=UPI00195A6577|nr:hypothetical protein [Gluconacetobacter azotocaptans]MBM9401196.1 hypothetical protein [Gluconacetobacter azotocaptans]